MLKDAKISTKVIVGFVIALAVAMTIGIVGRLSLQKNVAYLHDIAEVKLPSVQSLEEMVSGQNLVAAAQRGLIIRRMMDPKTRQENYDAVTRGMRQLAEGRRAYEPLPQTPEETKTWRQLMPVLEEWQRNVQTVVELAHEKDNLIAQGHKVDDPIILQADDKAFQSILRSKDSRVESGRLLDELVQMNVELSKRVSKEAAESASASSTFIMMSLLIGFLAVVSAAYVVIRGVNAALNALRLEAQRLADAAVNGQLATRGNVLAVPAELRSIVQGVNETLDAVIGPLNVAAEYVDRISKGDIPAKITDNYNGDFNTIKSNLNGLIASLNLLIDDMGNMSKQHDAGDIDIKMPEEKFEGAYRVLAKGVNDMVFGHIAVKKKAMACIAEFGRGNFDAELEKFPGKKVFINENIERMRTNIKSFVHEMAHMSKEHDAGDIDVRISEEKFEGGYRVMAKGVNDMVFGHIAVKKKAMACLAEFAAGNFDTALEKFPGKKAFINDTIELLRRNCKALVADANMLSQAAIEGKLGTRADASKHQGDFRKIVQGVNETLDSVIGPLNVAADYVDKISKGNIPARITDSYNGDFNNIKNNLNQCIDAVNNLVADAGVLSKAAVEGKLATRADASKHNGDFRKIVQGVNETLDSVIGPLNVAADYVDKISKGNIPARITDSYNGDFNNIKNNLNQCIDAVNNLVADAGVLSKAAVEGKLATRADASKHNGDFRKIVQGVNETLDSVIGPLNVAAEYVDKISKGNIPARITDSYNGDFNNIKNNLNQCIDAVNNLVADAGILSKAAVEGKLATRAEASKHNGDFRKIVQGVNETLDSVIGPLNVAADYVDKISKGNIPPKITDTYNGDFNTIKNNLNQCIDGLGGLMEANDALQRMAVNDYTHSVTGKYAGLFAEVGVAVNEVQTRIKHVIGIVVRVSNGDLTDMASLKAIGDGTGKRSEQDQLAPGLIRMIAAIGNLVADADMLSKAALEGKLATRADASKHQGDYSKVVQGVNETLDAVIGPLNVAADYVDRISKGNIPEKITDTYNGDFNTIKNNLNKCIDAVNKMSGDASMLTKAAIDGKLATRADATRHEGDFQKIVQGVNDTLDAVIGPLNVAADYVDKISKGNIPQKITETYNGDFNTLKNNLNQCIDAVNTLVADADTLVKAAVEGKLATRADATKHEGDFRKIVDGVNKTLDAVIAPVMEATGALELLARYDLRARVNGNYQGDHARIKDALNGTAKALQDALSQVADAVEQVSEASQQIAGSSQAVSQGASEQASSLEETSSSLEQMAGMTKQNADNTIQARSLAQTTKEAAEKGGTAMIRMTDAMEKIRAASQGTADIIKDINEIAFQTNLLALNAAVEAARAGDAGRGFAVVAEEVRNLALRSKEAAKRTEDLIKVSVGHAENGRVITTEVAGSLTEIVTAAAKVNDIVSEIAVASQEQSRGIEQVNTAVAEMDKVVQTAAANAEESSSAAEELASQSEELSSLVQRFELDRDNRTAARRHAPAVKEASAARRTALHPATIPPPRRGAVNASRGAVKKPSGANGNNGSVHKPSPEELIPLETDTEFQDF